MQKVGYGDENEDEINISMKSVMYEVLRLVGFVIVTLGIIALLWVLMFKTEILYTSDPTSPIQSIGRTLGVETQLDGLCKANTSSPLPNGYVAGKGFVFVKEYNGIPGPQRYQISPQMIPKYKRTDGCYDGDDGWELKTTCGSTNETKGDLTTILESDCDGHRLRGPLTITGDLNIKNGTINIDNTTFLAALGESVAPYMNLSAQCSGTCALPTSPAALLSLGHAISPYINATAIPNFGQVLAPFINITAINEMVVQFAQLKLDFAAFKNQTLITLAALKNATGVTA